jgi:hypothetical protein
MDRISAWQRRLIFAALMFTPGIATAQQGDGDDPRVIFESGFYNAEQLKEKSWRWMDEDGVIKLKNAGEDMVVKIGGRAPREAMPAPPTMKIFLNGEELEQFMPPGIYFEKEYKVPAAMQKGGVWSELRITTTGVIVPRKVNPKLNDDRHLGFQLFKFSWRNQAGAIPESAPAPSPRENINPAARDPDSSPPPRRGWLAAALVIGAVVVLILVVGLGLAFFRLRRPADAPRRRGEEKAKKDRT